MSVTASIVPSLTPADHLRLAVWQATQERTQAEYARLRVAQDLLAIEYPCKHCDRDEHALCTARVGPARRHRCLCWEMWHPGHDDNIEEIA